MVFRRLNTGSVKLSPQELRQALFPGEFVNFAERRSSEIAILQRLLGKNEPDFRMRDVELLVRYLAFRFYLNEYAGNLSGFLDETCGKFNANWESIQEDVIRATQDFIEALNTSKNIFGEKYFGHKWTGTGFERRLNRAVLDVLTFYFSKPDIRISAEERSEEVIEAFKNVCRNNTFRVAIEATTKSIDATFNRLSIWGEALQQVIGYSITIPTFNTLNNRIEYHEE